MGSSRLSPLMPPGAGVEGHSQTNVPHIYMKPHEFQKSPRRNGGMTPPFRSLDKDQPTKISMLVFVFPSRSPEHRDTAA